MAWHQRDARILYESSSTNSQPLVCVYRFSYFCFPASPVFVYSSGKALGGSAPKTKIYPLSMSIGSVLKLVSKMILATQPTRNHLAWHSLLVLFSHSPDITRACGTMPNEEALAATEYIHHKISAFAIPLPATGDSVRSGAGQGGRGKHFPACRHRTRGWGIKFGPQMGNGVGDYLRGPNIFRGAPPFKNSLAWRMLTPGVC